MAGGLKGLSEGRSDIYRIDPRKLHVKSGWNGRDFDDPENKAHVQMLADSISAVGVKEPLTVCWENEKAYLVNGECRLRATLLAIANGVEIKTVPVQTEDRHANDADRLFSQIVRNNGKPFSQMEQARVFKRLLDLGWQQTDIASKAGLSISWIGQVLNLLTLPEPVKAMVSAGQVSAAMAKKTVAVSQNTAEAVQALKDAVSVAEAEGKTRALPKHLNGGKANAEIEIIDGLPMDNKKGVEKTVYDAFEYADVDDSQTDSKGRPVVVITLPMKQWERIRNALKL